MQYIIDYIEKYGSMYFIEKPLNEIDALIFSQIVYNDFKDIVDYEDDITLKDAAAKFFSLHSDEELESLLGVVKRAAKILTLVANTKRFGGVVLKSYINNINDAIDKQISAINFSLPDGTIFIAFRGTDATVAGFKESAMLSYMFPIPAQIEALHYFQETAMLHKCEVYVGGHSKGGNLATFAAVNCSNSLKKRLKGIYAFDAPGFPIWFFDRYDYKQIKKILHNINPQGSLVGRALFSDKEPEIVVSDGKTSKQHNVTLWHITDDKFETTEAYTDESDKLSKYLNELVVYIGDEDLEVFYDALEKAATQLGISDFYDLKELDINMMTLFIDSHQTLTPEQKKRFNALVRKVMADVAKGYVSDYATKGKVYVKKVTSRIPFRRKTAEEQETES